MKNIETKKIKSKKEKELIKLDILVILICFIITCINIKVPLLETIIKYFKVYSGNFIACLNIMLANLWLFIIVAISKCFIIIAIYLAYRFSRMKNIRENSKYEVIENIDYYRERFNNITPAEISLITDLEIETKKDIAATILDMYQKGIVDFSEDNIIIKNENKAFRQSEKELINMIKSSTFDKEKTERWKQICINEAKEDNYIKEKSKKEEKLEFSINNILINISAILFIVSIALGIIFISSPTGEKLNSRLDDFDIKYGGQEQSELEIIQNNPEAQALYIEIISESGPLMILSTIGIGSLFILIGTPIYRRTRRKIYNKHKKESRYERTTESKILIEQIAGIKNYIHDFSLLSEKEKESIVLWEDFLVYAVLLEENEAIIKDIYKYKNINQNILNNIKNIANIWEI